VSAKCVKAAGECIHLFVRIWGCRTGYYLIRGMNICQNAELSFASKVWMPWKCGGRRL